MHLANQYYGHRSVLGDYAGVPQDRPIVGMVQHGWNRGTGFSPDDPPSILRPYLPVFVWNERNLSQARTAGYRRATAIGAPFLYLIHDADITREKEGTLAYPFHGWERQGAVQGEFHATYAKQLREREDGPITVCLYWLDYDDARIRSTYEAAGYKVTCHGTRRDDYFLLRQRDSILDHSRVVTNRAATALWYGAALGREIEVYGPEVGTTSSHEVAQIYAEHRNWWPDLFESGAVPPARAKLLAHQELGWRFMMPPNELRDALGWSGRKRVVGRTLAPMTRAMMTAKRRLEGW